MGRPPCSCSGLPLPRLLLIAALVVTCLLNGGHCVPKVPRCVVMAPNKVTVGVPFTAHVIVYEADGVKVMLNITDSETGALMTQGSVKTTRDAVTEVTLTLTSPPQQHDVNQYYVTLRASTSSRDIILPSQARVLVTFKQGHVFTQLSQFKYRPEDNVRGHLFSTDENLQILERPDMRIELLDPSGISVVWADRKSENKIRNELVSEGKAYTFELALPANAPAGQWRARARYGHKLRAYDDVYFQVSNSNLPLLVIAVTTEPKTILPTTSSINVTMSASFPVKKDTKIKGTARVEVLGLTRAGSVVSIGSSGTEPTPLSHGGTLPKATIALNYGDFRFADFRHLVVRSHVMNHVSGKMQTKSQVTGVFAKSPYVIKVSQSAPRYKPGLTYTLKVTIEDTSGNPVPELPIKVTVGTTPLDEKTNENGQFVRTEDISINRTSALTFQVRTTTYQGRKLPDALQAVVRHVVLKEETKGPEHNAFITIRKQAGSGYQFLVNYVNRNDDLDYGYLHYVATSKGKVRTQGKEVMSANNQFSFSLNQNSVQKKMAPAFHLLVFYVRRDGDVIADGIWVNVASGPCQNNIKLEGLPTSALEPRQKLTMTVKGDSQSYISTGLLEKRQFEGVTSMRLTKRRLSDLMSSGECKQDGGEMTAGVFYRAGLTLLTTTDLTVPARPNTRCTLPMLTTRRLYRHRHRRSAEKTPNTLLDDWKIAMEMKSVKIESSEEYQQEIYLNAMVGIWTVQAMGMSKTSGFCVSDVHEVVTRRNSHHMEVLVPHHSRVGETLEVTLLYWNSRFTQVKAQLQVYKGLCSKVRPNDWSTPKEFNVTANNQVSVSWPVLPLTAQKQIVRVWVEVSTDLVIKETTIVEKSFSTEMAGLERTFEQTFQLGTILTPLPSRSQDNPCFNILPDSTTQYDKITKEQSMTVRAEVPSDALYGTGKIEISVIGEPLGHILLDLPSKGIAKMVEHHPIGCGEQSMMRIGPLVYATLYLREINHIQHETETVEIVTKGILHMNKFRNETSGAYSTWTGKAPSTWLTAYVAKVFAQAFEVTEVNGTLASTICRSAMFVTSRQKSDGCFDDPLGIVMDESIAGGVDSITLMTAYVTVALLEVQNRLKTSRCAELPSVIDKAVEYLVGRSDEITDSYTLSMMAYGLLMSRNQRAKGEELLTRLLTTAVSNNDKNWKHWSIPRSSLTRKLRIRLIRNPVLTMEIETAAYALLALLEANKLSEASSVAMWLTSQHHSNGRFISTQDTVIALQALTLYRSKVYSTELEQDIKVQQIQPLSPHIDSIRLTNNARNLRHTYTYDLSKSQKDVLIQLDGKGEVRVEAVCTYNTLQNTDTCPFSLTTTILLPKDVSSGNTCYKYMGDSSSCVQTCYRYENSSGTNMAILYIGLHHLHKPNMANLNHIVNENENVDHVETTDKAVIFYLTQVPNVTHCVEFAVTPSSALPLNTMPVAVHLYDYHDPERLQCERFYQPNADVYSNKDKPIEYTYIKNNNEFVCGEEPQPPVHDYMKGNSAPVNSSDLEELLCNAVSPVNVYALNVTFLLDGDRFWDEHDADTGHIAYFVHAKVNKVLKKGSLPEPMHEEVRFYVQRSWSDFEEWAKDYKDHPHVIIGTDYEDHKGQTEIWLHLDKGDVYLQRLAPHKPWVSPQTRVAWKNLPRETRQMGRKNQRYLLNFNACKV